MANKFDESYGESGFSFIDRLTVNERLKFAHHTISEYLRCSQNKEFSLLELGCGYNGQNLHQLAKSYSGANFTGIDIAVSSKAPDRVQLIEMDLNEELPDEKFDIILSLAVIEHLENPISHFQHIRDLAHADTLMGLTTPSPITHLPWAILRTLKLIGSGQMHYVYFTGDGLKRLSDKCGLEVCEYRQFEMGLNQYIMMQLRR
jgi:2-polyprenyl-3-methyl-5-hydroxy-6-metoxy-1,4-benzoquinol methylase